MQSIIERRYGIVMAILPSGSGRGFLNYRSSPQPDIVAADEGASSGGMKRYDQAKHSIWLISDTGALRTVEAVPRQGRTRFSRT